MQQRVLLVAMMVLSCRREPVVDHGAPVAPVAQPSACDARGSLTAIAGGGSSSAIALAHAGARRVAFVADEDERALQVVDLEQRAITATYPLGTAPGHVLVARGRVHVSLPTEDAVVELAHDGSVCRRTAVPAEPVALASDGDEVLVASRRGRALTRIGGASLALARDPSAVLVDGRTAVVAHLVGSTVSVVSLDQGVVTRQVSLAWRDRVAFLGRPVADMPRFAVQARAVAKVGDRWALPLVLAYPGETKIEVSVATGYGAPSVRGVDGYFPHEAAIAALDPVGGRVHLDREVLELGKQRTSHGRVAPKSPPCLLPRAAAAHGGELVVACAGIDRLIVTRVDGDLAHGERLRVAVPAGPVAVAVEGDDAIVWSQFARSLSFVSLTTGATSQLPIAASTPYALAEGRALFHAPLGFDGRACASCHPEGRDDGLVWASPHGPMQAPVLAGRMDAAPYGWLGGAATLDAHLTETMKRIGAKPMHKETMDKLIAYVRALPSTEPRALTAVEKRGRALFHSAAVGCATCHEDGGSDGQRHDVGTGGMIDTPSLRGVASSAPYMHDGRYATLREAISGDAMGTTKHLGDEDVAALVAYLRTL